jgi:hypothetical protein
MLLIPTYNRSLVVGSNNGELMLEEKRKLISTPIYRYTVKDNKIINNSELLIWGIKETSRTLKIFIMDLEMHLKSGRLYKNKY